MTIPNPPTQLIFTVTTKSARNYGMCSQVIQLHVGEGHTLNKMFHHSTTPNALTAMAVATAT